LTIIYASIFSRPRGGEGAFPENKEFDDPKRGKKTSRVPQTMTGMPGSSQHLSEEWWRARGGETNWIVWGGGGTMETGNHEKCSMKGTGYAAKGRRRRAIRQRKKERPITHDFVRRGLRFERRNKLRNSRRNQENEGRKGHSWKEKE